MGCELKCEVVKQHAVYASLERRQTHYIDVSGSWNMSISQLALAYMLSLPGMGPVIPSSSTSHN